MACPPLITNFRFCLKPSNQITLAFEPRGDMPNVSTYTKKVKKVVDNGYWTLEVLQIVNTHSFEKENKSTQGYLVFGLPVRGGHAIYLLKYK